MALRENAPICIQVTYNGGCTVFPVENIHAIDINWEQRLVTVILAGNQTDKFSCMTDSRMEHVEAQLDALVGGRFISSRKGGY